MTLSGIDISRFQAGIDLTAVPCDLAIVGVSDGRTLNPVADQLYQSSRTAGKLRGVYHFYRNDPSEADWFVSQIAGYVGDAVIILDAETDCPDLPARCLQWLNRVKELTGVAPILYTYWNLLFASPYSHDWSAVAAAGYKLWEAQYPTSATNNGYGALTGPPRHDPFPELTMWQYSSSGRLPGWGGDLDLNIFYGDAAAWRSLAAPAGTQASAVTIIPEDDLTPEQANQLKTVYDRVKYLDAPVSAVPAKAAGAVWGTTVARPNGNVPALQELADAKTYAAQGLSKTVAAPTIDVKALAAEVAANLTTNQAHQFIVALGQALPKE